MASINDHIPQSYFSAISRTFFIFGNSIDEWIHSSRYKLSMHYTYDLFKQ